MKALFLVPIDVLKYVTLAVMDPITSTEGTPVFATEYNTVKYVLGAFLKLMPLIVYVTLTKFNQLRKY